MLRNPVWGMVVFPVGTSRRSNLCEEDYATTLMQQISSHAHRLNEDIHSATVRVIDAEGTPVGILSLEDALSMAEKARLDLVEISPDSSPPVCRLLDYGKYRYRQQKKVSEARRRQKTIDVKEIKMRPGIDEHDYQFKLRSVQRFLQNGDKVRAVVRFRGREVEYHKRGLDVLDRLYNAVQEIGRIEQKPKLDGRAMIMVLSPK